MSLNEVNFISDLKEYVKKLKVNSVLEVGALTGELMDAVNGEGIDINPKRKDVRKADIRTSRSKKRYDLVFSSGLLEHYTQDDAMKVIMAKARFSNRYVLSFVPNSNCTAYMNAKKYRSKKWPKEWREEDDYTVFELAKLHEKAGLVVVDKGVMGEGWAKLFGKEESEGYLVYCLARKREVRKNAKNKRSTKTANRSSRKNTRKSRKK